MINKNDMFKNEIKFINENIKAKSVLNLIFQYRDIELYEIMLTKFYGARILKQLLHYRLIAIRHTYEDNKARSIEITGLGAWILKTLS
jgi:hypothetical protein